MRKMFSEKQVEKMISDKLESMGIKVENGALVISKNVTIAENKALTLPTDVTFADGSIMNPKSYDELTTGDIVITAYTEE